MNFWLTNKTGIFYTDSVFVYLFHCWMKQLLGRCTPLIQFLRIRCWDDASGTRFPIHHVCPKCLSALLCDSALQKNSMKWEWHSSTSNVWISIANWFSILKILWIIQFTSFCSPCTLLDNSKIVFLYSTNLPFAIMSKVELWNFFDFSISQQNFWWASRSSKCCCNNCPWRNCWFRRWSFSAWAQWRSFRWDSRISPNFRVIINSNLKFVDSCLTLNNNSLFLIVQQSSNLCTMTIWLSRPSRFFSNRSSRFFGHRRRRLTDKQVFSLRVMDMYFVSFTQHIHECDVIVFGVLGKTLIGERRWGQELCVRLDVSLPEVVGVGPITCEGVKLVKRVHTLFDGLHLLATVVKEVEKVRQEVREVGLAHIMNACRWLQLTDTARTWVKRCSVQCDGALKDKKTTHSRVRVDVLCVEVSVDGHVVIGVDRVIVQRHNAEKNNDRILIFEFFVR